MATQKQKKYFFNLSKVEVKENLIPSTISVVVCFVVFLVNDIYGFVNWRKMKKRQNL